MEKVQGMIKEDFYENLNVLITNKEFDKLETYFIQSLEDAKEVNDYSLYLAITNEMLAFYKSTGDSKKVSEAIDNIVLLMDELYKNIRDSFEENCMKSDAAALATNLAFDYLKYRQLTKAKNSFELAIEILEKTNWKQEEYYCASLTGLGEVYYELKEFALAVSSYERALNQIEKSFGYNESYIMVCNNLAAIKRI